MPCNQEMDDLEDTEDLDDAEEQDGCAETYDSPVAELRGKFKTRSLRKAVDLFCRECNGEKYGGKFYDCLDHDCVFYPWKKGKGVYESAKRPAKDHLAWLEEHGTGVLVARIVTPEQIAKMRAGLEKYEARLAETEDPNNEQHTRPQTPVGSWRQRPPK